MGSTPGDTAALARLHARLCHPFPGCPRRQTGRQRYGHAQHGDEDNASPGSFSGPRDAIARLLHGVILTADGSSHQSKGGKATGQMYSGYHVLEI